ncbi:MAG: hypothetical protein IT456_23675 [Planctomycetes bacterium]|nr:hypothetical protein [Planctomycetota bacterium]
MKMHWQVTAACFAPAAVLAQAPQERTVQLGVTSVSDRSVYLDHGRDVGLQVGMVVQLFAPGVASLDVEIRSVSNTSARAELPPGALPPPVGTRGEARVQEASRPAAGTAPKKPAAVEHPPWTRREGERRGDQPLLVPTFGQRPDQRPATLDGRLYAIGQWNRDSGGDRSSDYLLARAGVRADATNFLGAGERIRFAGELDERRVVLPDAPDEDDANARLDLLSVAFGTEQWAPTGVEIGRFFSQFLPELGLADGVEVVRRYEGGFRMGGGLASYPRPFPARDTGEDLGVHAFVDFTADARRSFAAAIGVQKTWHQGAPDRDLVLFRLEGRPTDQVSLYGSAKVDFYTSSDTLKGSGLEVTELFGVARWDAREVGTGLTVSHFAWPELKRAEYQNLPEELVRNGAVDRASWSGWWRPVEELRLQARTDLWRDQDRDGTSFGLDADVRDVVGDGSNLSVSLFQTDGGYSSGPGLRATLRAPIAAGSWRVGYRWSQYDLTGLVSGSESYTRQSVELGLSTPVSDTGDLDCSLERWFGDREDAWSFGFYMQWRF